MAQTNLQAAYDAKAKADADSDAAKAKVTDLQGQLKSAQDDAQAKAGAAERAEATLESAVPAVPQNKLVRTGDGKYLVAFGGQFHVYDEVDASAVTFDDGSAPAPEPTPTPAPEPAPADPNAPEPDHVVPPGFPVG